MPRFGLVVGASQYNPAVPGSTPASTTVAEFVLGRPEN